MYNDDQHYEQVSHVWLQRKPAWARDELTISIALVKENGFVALRYMNRFLV